MFPIMVYFPKDELFEYIEDSSDIPMGQSFVIMKTNCTREEYEFGIKMFKLGGGDLEF